MQKAEEFSETNISLGVGRGKLIKAWTVSPKAKNKLNCGYCPTGCGFVELTSDNRCPACGAKFMRPKKWDSTTGNFENIISKNQKLVDEYIPTGFINYNAIQLPIQIEHHVYVVPIELIQQFRNIEYTDDKDTDQFFRYVKSMCDIIKI